MVKGNQWSVQLMTPCPLCVPHKETGAGMRPWSLVTAISKNPKLMNNKANLKCYLIF